MNLRLLALETSTEWCSVAVLDGDTLSAQHFFAGVSHSERILGAVDQVLADAKLTLSQLHAIAFGSGPGSFTGLRVACGVAQGLAFGAQVPVVPVSSTSAVALDAWVQTGCVDRPVLVALDARMQEIYVAAYRFSGTQARPYCQTVRAPSLLPLGDWSIWRASEPSHSVVAGSALHVEGVKALPDNIVLPDRGPNAQSVAYLGRALYEAGEAIPAEQAMPIYIRDKVAFTHAERQARILQGLGSGNPTAKGQA